MLLVLFAEAAWAGGTIQPPLFKLVIFHNEQSILLREKELRNRVLETRAWDETWISARTPLDLRTPSKFCVISAQGPATELQVGQVRLTNIWGTALSVAPVGRALPEGAIAVLWGATESCAKLRVQKKVAAQKSGNCPYLRKEMRVLGTPYRVTSVKRDRAKIDQHADFDELINACASELEPTRAWAGKQRVGEWKFDSGPAGETFSGF